MRPVPAVVADTAPIEPIPNVPVGRILGLLGILEDNNERINLFELSTLIGQEFGETITIVKAAEMLDLVGTPKNVRIDPICRQIARLLSTDYAA